jgi:hypothetical protein
VLRDLLLPGRRLWNPERLPAVMQILLKQVERHRKQNHVFHPVFYVGGPGLAFETWVYTAEPEQ